MVLLIDLARDILGEYREYLYKRQFGGRVLGKEKKEHKIWVKRII